MKIENIKEIQKLIPSNYISRSIFDDFYKHVSENEKVTVLYGARQVGKSSLVLKVIEKYLKTNPKTDIFFYNLDNEDIEFRTPDEFINSINSRTTPGNKVIILIDEAQRHENIGLFVKYVYDKKLDYKFILTGSASLDIKQNIKEPLTGRKKEFFLSSLNLTEILQYKKINPSNIQGYFSELTQILEEYILFGGYPEVVSASTTENKKEIITEISKSYILKDLSNLFDLKNLKNIRIVTSFLGENISNLISVSNISSLTGITRYEVEKIISALEKTFVLWQVPPFSTNKYKELIHNPKIMFMDSGIRNAFLGKLSPELIFADKGKLFENVLGLICLEKYGLENINFWRTQNGTEVDFVCKNTKLNFDIYEAKVKWVSDSLPANMKSFSRQYKVDLANVITMKNYWEILR